MLDFITPHHPEDRGRVPASSSGTESFGGQRQCDLPERRAGPAELEHPRDGLLFVYVRHNPLTVDPAAVWSG